MPNDVEYYTLAGRYEFVRVLFLVFGIFFIVLGPCNYAWHP